MMEYGTHVVGGVTPGKGGLHFAGPGGRKVPIFETMEQAVAETGANTTVIYVPPAFAADAIMEAADAKVPFIVAITEGIPVLDMMRVYTFVQDLTVRILGPNCPGLLPPGKSKLGIMPGQIATRWAAGVGSRSGTLTH